MERFVLFFSELPDPRASNARHELTEVLFIALLAMLCGAENCSDMADFGAAKEPFLRELLKLKHGTPSHDTFSRVFRQLDAERFEAAFARFTAGFAKGLKGVVALDGKAVRGAYARGRKATPLHLVNVWAAEARLAVGQRLSPGRNEVAGALEAVALLDLAGCILTADALHCRQDMAALVRERGGDYVLALKENQPALHDAARSLLDAVPAEQIVHLPAKKLHDRVEQRSACVALAPGLAERHGFAGLAAVGRILTRRTAADGESEAVRHFVLSTPLSPERLLEVVRCHWGIENQLHWVLDVVLDEDGARSRSEHAPRNLATMRKIALNLLRSHPRKASIRRNIKRAGWENDFLLSLLAQMR